jgi:MFS transporter, DHA1 family, tetracycline resistance protein
MWVLPCSFLYALILFMVDPIVSLVLIDMACIELNDDDCGSASVSARASMIYGYTALATGIPCFILSGLFGSLADKFGRKTVMMLPVVGNIVYTLSILIIQVFKPTSYIAIISAGSLILGLTGYYPIYIMAIFSYASDCTISNPNSRKFAYSVTEGAMFIPKIFGPVFSGVLAKYFGYSIPLLLMESIAGFTVLWILIMPESLHITAASRTQKLQLQWTQTWDNMKMLFSIRPRYGQRSPVPYVLAAFLIYYFAYCGHNAIYVIYVQHRFDWDSAYVGYYEGVEGFVYTVAMMFVPSFVDWVLGTELRLITWIKVGYASRVVFWAIFGSTASVPLAFSLLAITFVSGSITPYTRTILSNSCPQEQQAQMFSGFSAVESVSSLLAPLFNVGYSLSVGICGGLMFYIMAGLTLASLLVIQYVDWDEDLRANLPDHSHGSYVEVQKISTQRASSDVLKAGGAYDFGRVLVSPGAEGEGEESAKLLGRSYLFSEEKA